MCIAIVWDETPGPPFVRKNGSSNIWKQLISVVVITKNKVGVSIGSLILKKI